MLFLFLTERYLDFRPQIVWPFIVKTHKSQKLIASMFVGLCSPITCCTVVSESKINIEIL